MPNKSAIKTPLKTIKLPILLICLLTFGIGLSQESKNALKPGDSPQNLSTDSPTGLNNPDSLKQSPNDSLKQFSEVFENKTVADSTSDSLKTPPALSRVTFNHKEQVIVGSLVMTGLALILVTMNNYNPK